MEVITERFLNFLSDETRTANRRYWERRMQWEDRSARKYLREFAMPPSLDGSRAGLAKLLCEVAMEYTVWGDNRFGDTLWSAARQAAVWTRENNAFFHDMVLSRKGTWVGKGTLGTRLLTEGREEATSLMGMVQGHAHMAKCTAWADWYLTGICPQALFREAAEKGAFVLDTLWKEYNTIIDFDVEACVLLALIAECVEAVPNAAAYIERLPKSRSTNRRILERIKCLHSILVRNSVSPSIREEFSTPASLLKEKQNLHRWAYESLNHEIEPVQEHTILRLEPRAQYLSLYLRHVEQIPVEQLPLAEWLLSLRGY